MKLALFQRRDAAEASSLDQLWAEAEEYGAVRIWANPKCPLPSRYHCVIEFLTIPGTRLEAKGGYDLPLKQALGEAIENARTIAKSFAGKT